MRKLLYLAVILSAAAVVGSPRVRGEEPQQAQKEHKQAQTAEATQDHAAQDPNYRWHNGQWWYWMPQQKNWMVWNGSQWMPYAARAANRDVNRSFSYQDDAAPAARAPIPSQPRVSPADSTPQGHQRPAQNKGKQRK